MRSIRWSLVLYVVLLVGLALGAVSTFVYENTRQVLEDKRASDAEHLSDQHDRDTQTVRYNLDKELLTRAQTLASQAQFQMNFREGRQRYLALVQVGLLADAIGPASKLTVGGRINSLGLLGEAVKHPLADGFHVNVAEIQFDEHALPVSQGPEGERKYYFQINVSIDPASKRSLSLGNDYLPFDPEAIKKGSQLDWSFEDKELLALPGSGAAETGAAERNEHKGHRVRCVTLKTPIAWGRFGWGPPNPGGEHGGRPAGPPSGERTHQPDFIRSLPPPPRPPAPDKPERAAPLFYIQCASDTEKRDRDLAGLDQDLSNSLEKLDEDSRATLASLRNRLLLINLATFAAMVVGGCWLIQLGLSPLHRLSEAVSKVSTRDFELPFDNKRLPRELRPIVERLRVTLDQLKRAFTREKQAAADISHELRTPVAVLLTSTEVALRRPRTPEQYREVLEECRSTGQQMSQMVERLLALARLDAGVDTLRPREVDAADLAEQCAGLMRPLAEARELKLQVHHDGPAPLVTDPNKFREVLTNLLHNAIEYNRPQGTVDLTLARHNGHLCVEVRDTGIGIAPQAREHIFERFFRADPSRQADCLHAGLGLAIVKGYVDLMGGSISVESAEGEGSTFRVELPVG